jgi:hypothetical protein
MTTTAKATTKQDWLGLDGLNDNNEMIIHNFFMVKVSS